MFYYIKKVYLRHQIRTKAYIVNIFSHFLSFKSGLSLSGAAISPRLRKEEKGKTHENLRTTSPGHRVYEVKYIFRN